MLESISPSLGANVAAGTLLTHFWFTLSLLFLLFSVINERLVSAIILLFRFPFRSLGRRNQDNIHQGVYSVLTFCSALLLTVLCHLDLWHLLAGESLSFYPTWPASWLNVMGLLLSALFISLGSQLWHELLQFIRQLVHNQDFQRRLLTQTAFLQQSAELEAKRQQVVAQVKEISPKLQNLPHYAGYRVVNYLNEGTVVQFYFRETPPPLAQWSWIRTSLKVPFEVLLATPITQIV